MTKFKLYALPVLGRYGLTHGLLAWARARVWCEQQGATMLAPFWFKVRVGPYLRGERDKRNYFLLFHAGPAISGLRRLAILFRSAKIDVGAEWPADIRAQSKPVLLRFHNALRRNEKKSFNQIVGYGPFLRAQLLAISRSRYHPQAEASPFIAVHVRLGDFSEAEAGRSIPAGTTNTRLPLDWYVDRLQALRSALDAVVPVIVFSDGSDAELASLLSLEQVRRAPRQQSITDLLHMGLGSALIASGSGFSLWGAFLGSTPRISYPGQSKVPIDDDSTRDIESDYGDAIPASFVAHVRQRLGR